MHPAVLRTRRHLALCIAAIGLAIIMSMTACAGGPPDDAGGRAERHPDAAPGPSTLADAVAATRAIDRARVELRTTVGNAGTPVTVVYRAAFTDAGLRAEASSDMSQVAAALAAAGQQLDGDWSQPTGVVIDGDTVYAQLGPMAAALGRDPSDWVRTRLADLAGTGADNDTLALVLDPLGPLDLLRRPVLEIGEVAGDEMGGGEMPGDTAPGSAARGDAALDGAASAGGDRGQAGASGARAPAGRHLRAQLDLRGPPGGTSSGDEAGDGSPAPGSFEERLVAAGYETLPVDVWVGDGGVVHRLVVTVQAADTLTTTFDVYDVGADITIDVPDASQVVAAPPSANGSNGADAGLGRDGQS